MDIYDRDNEYNIEHRTGQSIEGENRLSIFLLQGVKNK